MKNSCREVKAREAARKDSRVFLKKTQRTRRTLSYLEPISGSLHVPIEGVYRAAEKTEDRVAIGEEAAQNHTENASESI